MRDFLTVFIFEFMEVVKKRSTMVITMVLVLLAFLAALSPMLLFSDTEEDQPQTNLSELFEDTAFHLGELTEETQAIFVSTFGLEEHQLYESPQALNDAVDNEDHNIGFDILSLTSMRTIYFNRGDWTNLEPMVESVLHNVYRWQEYGELGIDPTAINEIEETVIENEVIILGRDSVGNYMITYVLSFVTYMFVLLYGTSVATAVAREKDSRTMELLVTSTKPTNLIVGKVVAVISASLLQITLVILAAIIGFNIAKDFYPEFVLQTFESSLTIDMIAVTLIFALGGYILYMFIYAALGSLVSRIEDVSNAVLPITFIAMIALFIAMFSLADVNGLPNVIASIVPLTSFIAMPTRYLLAVVPFEQMVLAVGLLVVTTIFFAYLAIKIYRWGTLYYGNKIGFFRAVREVFKVG